MGVVNHYSEGIKLYRTGKWDDAIESFTEALRLNPDDRLTAKYIDRCNLLKENPPEGEWDGVWKMTSK